MSQKFFNLELEIYKRKLKTLNFLINFYNVNKSVNSNIF